MLEGQQPTLWGLSITFTVIAITAVMFRLYARRIQHQKLGPDDWTILVALILSIGVTVNLLIMTQLGGLGTHLQYNPDGSLKNVKAFSVFEKTIFAFELLTWPTLGVTKISVLLLYQRIFATPRYRNLCWFMIAVNCAWIVTFTLALTFSCLPVEENWNPSIISHCVNLKALFTTGLATDTTTDLLVLLLPVYKVWQLNMSTARRIEIICMFLLGGLVSIVGIIRIHFLTQVYAALEVQLQFADTTWVYTKIYYWQIIETNVGVLSACLPTLRPVQDRLRQTLTFHHLKGSFKKLIPSSSQTNAASDIRLGSMEEGLNGEFNGNSMAMIASKQQGSGGLRYEQHQM